MSVGRDLSTFIHQQTTEDTYKETQSAGSTSSRGSLTQLESYARSLGGSKSGKHYPHPYGPEIAALNVEDEVHLSAPRETLFKSMEDTPCEWVSTPEALEVMARELDASQEFAVDLEVLNLFISFDH